MIFKEFFKPKWQHRKSSVREQAIAALDAEQDKAVLLEIVHRDSEPRLRCMAVRKLMDLPALRDISRQAGNWEVAQLAAQRYQQLLAGRKEPVPPLAARLALVAEIDDAELLEFLARHAREAELRQAALEKVVRDGVLGEIASNDAAAQVRLLAVEKITQEAVLERVAKDSRNRDKRVYRIAKERLDGLVEARERPLRLRAQREELCRRLELLLKAGDWERSGSELERIEQQWREIEGGPDADSAARYAGLKQACGDALEHYNLEQAALATLRAEKQALCESVAGLQAELDDAQSLNAEEAAEVERELDTLQARWEQIAGLGGLAEERFQNCFRDACAAVRQRQQALQAYYRIGQAMRELCKKAETLLRAAPDKPPARHALEELQQRWDAIETPAEPNLLLRELAQRFQQAMLGLAEQREQRREVQKQHEKDLKQALRDLESALEQGELQQARDLEAQAQALLKQLAGLPKPRLGPLEHRLRVCTAQVRKLRGWRHWGNTLERENLCESMEALIGLEGDPEDIARRIREAQAEWKSLSHGDESGHALWQRFHAACQAAYAPCQAYFAAKAEQRQAHLEHRQAVCERLEAFLAATDWTALHAPQDWKTAYHDFQAMRKEYFQTGPVDHKHQKPLEKRFDGVVAAIETHLERERKRNQQARRALIDKAEALGRQEDIRKAVAEVKQLQQEWQISVPGAQKEERELWRAFRKACDGVFKRRQQEQADHEKTMQAHLEQKAALCAAIEALAELPAAEAEGIPARLHKLQGEWQELGPVSKKDQPALEKRYAQARRAALARHTAWQDEQIRAQIEALREKARLCTALETLDDPARGETILSAWEGLPALAEAPLDRAISARFQRARAAVEAGQAPLALPADLLRDLDLLCIRMELLAGIDSPPESVQARMAYQVERLSKAMGGDKSVAADKPLAEARELERAWYLRGPVGTGHPLEQRFARDCAAFYRNAAALAEAGE